MKRTVLMLALAFGLPAAWADVIHFRDGTVREGKVVRQTEQTVEVEFTTPAGSLKVVYPAGKIARIEMKKTAHEVLTEDYRNRLAALDVQDSAAWAELAQWCSGHNMLQRQARDAYEMALERDPDHPGARKALGYVQFRGVWMTQTEAMGAQGYVRHNDKWITSEAYGEVLRTEIAQDAAERIETQLPKKFTEREKELLTRIERAQERADDSERRLTEANNRLRDLIDRIERLEHSRPRTIIIRELYPRLPTWWIQYQRSRTTGTTGTTNKAETTPTPKPGGPLKK